MDEDGLRSSRFPPDGDPSGISPKFLNVALHPLHSSTLVLNAKVTRYPGLAVGEESEGAETVIGIDNNNILSGCEASSIINVEWSPVGALFEGAAVEEQAYGDKLGV